MSHDELYLNRQLEFSDLVFFFGFFFFPSFVSTLQRKEVVVALHRLDA